MGRPGRRRKRLLDEPKEKRGFWKFEEALDRTLWRTCLVRGYGSVVRQTTWRRMSVSPVPSVPLMLILPSSGLYFSELDILLSLLLTYTHVLESKMHATYFPLDSCVPFCISNRMFEVLLLHYACLSLRLQHAMFLHTFHSVKYIYHSFLVRSWSKSPCVSSDSRLNFLW
jgi:hypothetical protein